MCIRERNFRFHMVATAYVLTQARHFLETPGEWGVLILTVALVLCAEGFNTAVEHAVDLACPKETPRAGFAKDIAAGAVLICALAAIGVAVCLFGRPEAWIRLFELWRQQWWRPVLIVSSGVLSVYFVFHK